MMKLLYLVSLLWAATVVASSTSLRGVSNSGEEQDARLLQDNPAFIEQNGRIVMQVESVPLVAPWVFESSRPGFTGNGYYRMTGNTVQSGPPNGRLIFNLQINNPGTYEFNIHSNKDHPSDPTWSNDCFVKLVGAAGERGQDVKVFQSGSSFTWRWSTRYEFRTLDPHQQDPKVTFPTAGNYRFEVSGRSKGFYMDRIVFFMSNGNAARNLNLPESPRVGANSPTPAPPTNPPPTNPPPTNPPPTNPPPTNPPPTNPPPTNPPPTNSPPAPFNAAVTSLALIDATTDGPIVGYGNLPASSTLVLSSLPTTQLNIQAITSGAGIGSVVFNLNGAIAVENIAPWAMKRDNGGDFQPWTPAPGEYALTVTPYSGSGGSGTPGTSKTIAFTVANGPNPTPPPPTNPPPTNPPPTNPPPTNPPPTNPPPTNPPPTRAPPTNPPPTPAPPTPTGSSAAVTQLVLIDATTDRAISGYTDLPPASTLVLSSLPTTQLNIQAITSGAGIASVVFNLEFNLNGEISVENFAPWALKKDTAGDFEPWTPEVGEYVLTATPYSGPNGSGNPGTSKAIAFTVVSEAPTSVHINAGGAVEETIAGTTWLADAAFVNGGRVYQQIVPISNADSAPQKVYQSERWFDSPLIYTIPVMNGPATIIIHLAEIYGPNFAVGKRVFDIKINGALVDAAVDIISVAGAGRTAITREHFTVVTGSAVTVEFVGVVENPKVSAIEVFPAFQR